MKGIFMTKELVSIQYFDEESESEAFATIRKFEDKIALSLSIQNNGDIDTLMTKEKASEIAKALLIAVSE